MTQVKSMIEESTQAERLVAEKSLKEEQLKADEKLEGELAKANKRIDELQSKLHSSNDRADEMFHKHHAGKASISHPTYRHTHWCFAHLTRSTGIYPRFHYQTCHRAQSFTSRTCPA